MTYAYILAFGLALVGSCSEPTSPHWGCYQVIFYTGAPDSVKPTKLLKLSNVSPGNVDGTVAVSYAKPSPDLPTSADWMVKGFWWESSASPADSIRMLTGDQFGLANNQIRYNLGYWVTAEEAPPGYQGTAEYFDGTGVLAWTSVVRFAPRSCAD